MRNLKGNFLKLIESGISQAKGIADNFNELIDSIDIDAHMEYLNEQKKALIKKSNELFSDFNDMLKQVKENLTDFSVTVPFDESTGEKLSYSVKDGKLTIEVTYSDDNSTRCNSTSVLIPGNCDIDALTVSTNKIMKSVTITIPKTFKKAEVEEEPETPVAPAYYCPTLGTLLTEDEVEDGKTIDGGHPVVKLPTMEEIEKKPKRKKKPSKKAEATIDEMEAPQEPLNEPTEESVEDDGEIEAHVSEKLAKRLQKNVSRYSETLKRDQNGRFVRRKSNKA